MSWLSVFLRGGGKSAILADLLAALLDGKITSRELQGIVTKVGLGVVEAGLPGRLQQIYEMTDPDKLLTSKTVQEVVAKIREAHIALGLILQEVK